MARRSGTMKLLWNGERGDRVMATTRRSRAYDPEFDRSSVASLGRPVFDLPHHYQRLVANPFLAFLGLVGWFAALRVVSAVEPPETRTVLFGATFVSLLLVCWLPQYHCLDCGETGRLAHWRSHACDAVQLRRELGRPRRLRGPTPVVQTVLWFYAAIVCAILVYIVWR